MSIADNRIAAVTPSLDNQRHVVNQLGRRLDDTLHTLAAEHRVRARRQRAAVDGIVVAASTATLILGGVWLALLGPVLIAVWHTCAPTGGGHRQGDHRRDAEAPRHTSRRTARLRQL